MNPVNRRRLAIGATVAWIIAGVVILAAVIAGCVVMSVYSGRCERAGGTWHSMPSGRGLCVSPDGRIINP